MCCYQLVSCQLGPTLVLMNISLEVINKKTLIVAREMILSTENRKLEIPVA